MFVRVKKSGVYEYLQLVRNERIDGKVRQQVVATPGHLDVRREGTAAVAATIKIGPVLVFERLWRESGFPQILGEVLSDRRFEFAMERAVFLTVLHRLFDPGSDRAAEV